LGRRSVKGGWLINAKCTFDRLRLKNANGKILNKDKANV